MQAIRLNTCRQLAAIAAFSFLALGASAQDRPNIAISLKTNHATVTWSTNFPDFLLESTGNLGGSWTNVAEATNCTATLPMVSSNQFFRLKEREMVSVTYVANEGIFISGRGRKVLIDGTFLDAIWPYFETSPSNALIVPPLITNALPPFDNIDVILATHYHDDHLNGGFIFQHMTNDPATILIGPAQVYSAIETAAGANFGQITNRITVATPASNTSTNVQVGDMNFRVARMAHTGDSATQNTGFLFTVGGLKFFHSGDFFSTTLSQWQVHNLAAENIDVAMLNGYLLNNKSRAQDVIAYLRPKAVIWMHLGISEVESYRSIINTMTNLPPVYTFDTTMTTLRFPAK